MKSFASVAEYINAESKPVKALLQKIRTEIKSEITASLAKVKPNAPTVKVSTTKMPKAPKLTECINYGMPTFQLDGKNLIHFAEMKGHLGFYPAPSGVSAFEVELKKAGIDFSKGCIRFKHDKPLPIPLIRKIVKFRVKETTEKMK